MRWLVCHPGPNFSVADVYAGWCEGLRDCGQQVARYNLDDRLTFYEAALLPVDGRNDAFRYAFTPEKVIQLAMDGIYSQLYRWRPDVLMIVSGFFAPYELLDTARRYGTRVVVLHTESPYEDQRQIDLAAHADLNLVNDPTNLDRFRQIAPTEYMCHSYRPHIHHPGPAVADLAADFAFVGTGYPSRIGFFEAMNLDGLDVLLAGNWSGLGEDSPLRKHIGHDIDECLDNALAVPIYRSAKVGINLYRREAERPELSAGWAMGPREVELAACGAFFLRDPRPEGDELFPMLPTVASPEDAAEQVRWWLDHEDERREAARLAQEAIADRTFRNHAAALLSRLDK